jgi:hypothetical protein
MILDNFFMIDSKQYSPVRRLEQPRYANQKNTQGKLMIRLFFLFKNHVDVEPIYEEPTQLTENTPVFMRC